MTLILPERKIYRIDLDLKKILDKMFTIFVPQASEVTWLKHGLNALAPTDPIIKLFVNNITPAESDTAGTYTEMTTQGYAAKTLAGASWTFTQATPSHADFAQQTWTFDGTGGSTLVYGYFVVKTTSGLQLYAERFTDGPYTIQNSGDQILITPYISLD